MATRKQLEKENREQRIAEMVAVMPPEMSVFYSQVNEAWEEWIEFKRVQHNEKYKLARTELQQIKNLRTISKNDPDTANGIIEYAQMKLWHGLYMPKDEGLIYQKNILEITERFKHITDPLIKAGFPREAWLNTDYFNTIAAEISGNYKQYIAETMAFFGETFPILSQVAWNKFRNQEPPFNADLVPVTINPYPVVSNRLQWCIDYNPKRHPSDFDEYFIRKCLEQKKGFDE